MRVRVPASSANLGPGFDVLAAALGLHIEVEVEETGSFEVVTDLEIARDRRNLCVRGFERLADPARFKFTITSDVPLSGGLGTSAAAIVAGLVLAQEVSDTDADLLAEATEIEGHPDNVAAALHGGFLVCAGGEADRLDVPSGLEAVMVVPHDSVRTREARAVLPGQVPMSEAVFNIGHTALLVLGIERGDPDLIARGLADRLHQDRRAHLFPRSTAVLERARDLGALGATVSGAGPAILLWALGNGEQVEAAARTVAGAWADVMRVPFEPLGATLVEN